MVKIACFIGEKLDFYLDCFHLHKVGFLVTFLLKKSPLSLPFGLTIIDFYKKEGHVRKIKKLAPN